MVKTFILKSKEWKEVDWTDLVFLGVMVFVYFYIQITLMTVLVFFYYLKATIKVEEYK